MARMTRVAAPLFMCLLLQNLEAQPVSGVWHGRVDAGTGLPGNTYRVELKLARLGDSLYGTAYYHRGRREYARFPIKGYFNPFDGTVTWWHDEKTGVDEKGRAVPSPFGAGTSFVTDFNCPGGEEMSLDGELQSVGTPNGGKNRPVHFDKVQDPLFRDEWDEVLNDPSKDLASLLERQEEIASPPPARETPMVAAAPAKAPVAKEEMRRSEKTVLSGKEEKPKTVIADPIDKPTPESLFKSRESKVVATFPLVGDTLELNFYDHAEIDGDTVSIFHNGMLLKKHLLLKAEPFTLRFHVGSLPERNDFTMVAENLGSIPPNTSLLVAYVDGVRQEARLESTEKESAAIRFEKPRERR